MTTNLIGILNITPDSFSDGGKFNSLDAALVQLQKLLDDGANMIDIGAESTRPTATPISWLEEWSRLENILPALVERVKKFNQENGRNVETSIDSYHFETIKKACEVGVDIVNDVKGLEDDRIIDFIAQNQIKTILMHNAPLPVDENLVANPYLNVTMEILSWARHKISYLRQKGLEKEKLIFDLGIGFNKNAYQSIRVLKAIDAYRVLGLPLYIGHSKKSFLDAIDIEGDRAQKTLVVSEYLMKKKVEYLRVHDVKEHRVELV